MKEQRERLLGLIKMMEAIRQENFTSNKEGCSESMTDNEADYYIPDFRLTSIRELTRMFVEELYSKYIQCSEDDEIVIFIKNMIIWLKSAYNFIIENNACGLAVRQLKLCNQSLKDYESVYEEAETKYINPDTKEYYIHHFSFGKKPKDQQYTSNTVQPITINLTFTGDSKENEITAEKLKNMIDKYSKDNGRRFV